MKWTKEVRAVWERLALGGMTLEKRYERKNGTPFSMARWYMKLPVQSYVNGPYSSKTAAVMRAATLMELDVEEVYRGSNASVAGSSEDRVRDQA